MAAVISADVTEPRSVAATVGVKPTQVFSLGIMRDIVYSLLGVGLAVIGSRLVHGLGSGHILIEKGLLCLCLLLVDFVLALGGLDLSLKGLFRLLLAVASLLPPTGDPDRHGRLHELMLNAI